MARFFSVFKHSPTFFLKCHRRCPLRNVHAKHASRRKKPTEKKLPPDAIEKTAAPPPQKRLSFSRQEAWPKALIQIKNQEICMENGHRARPLAGGAVGGVPRALVELRPLLFA